MRAATSRGTRVAVALAFALVGAGGVVGLAQCGGGIASPATGDAASGADGTLADHAAGPGDAGGDTRFVVDGLSPTDTGPGCSFGCPTDGGPLPACPAAPPTPGTPCSSANEVCEYGTSWWYVCNTVLECSGGTWRNAVSPGNPQCGPFDAGTTCPATWAEANTADATPPTCPFVTCVYPGEGFCGCGIGCGGGGAPRPAVTGIFLCFEAGAACPEPRPLMGTPCSGDTFCEYGGGCGCGQQQRCVGGIWQGGPTPPCP
jgi:hypothetical protein